ncbi:cysteine hydrolase family protein [Paucidesulfovibrio longus]|uniref:cysteine hydrolase family protein n=1 Tax=Paucidesulfovibrio longus TaxID=889 RepID=UPI0003B30275|nr:cysteine hydrolase family protein [Paucidesulfovibrio longus]
METKHATEGAALVLVDVQNDYFAGGRMALPGAERAGKRAAALLGAWRAAGLPVVHVRHESVRPGATFFLPGTQGAAIRAEVAPLGDEAVLTKQYPNSFRDTGLEAALRERGVSRLVVAGMMTNMCIDATVRAAFDLGFECLAAHDACAACALEFNGLRVGADQVHAAFLAALGLVYARLASVEELVGELDAESR